MDLLFTRLICLSSAFDNSVQRTSKLERALAMARNLIVLYQEKLFHCTCCKKMSRIPVFVCRRVHFFCARCNFQLIHCPECGSEIIKRRCLGARWLTETLSPCPCRYSSYGCTKVLSLCSRIVHEYDCRYQQFRCPVNNCTTSLPFSGSTILHHLFICHTHVSPITMNTTHIPVRLDRRTVLTRIIFASQRIFYAFVIILHKNVYFLVMLCGNRGDARNFVTKVTIYGLPNVASMKVVGRVMSILDKQLLLDSNIYSCNYSLTSVRYSSYQEELHIRAEIRIELMPQKP